MMNYGESRLRNGRLSATTAKPFQRIGEVIWERLLARMIIRQMVIAQAAKRAAAFVKPVEIVSWDHRKLGGGY